MSAQDESKVACKNDSKKFSLMIITSYDSAVYMDQLRLKC